MDRPKTIFIDIDGTLIYHPGDRFYMTAANRRVDSKFLLPGVKEKFTEWDLKGYKIILITGRRESDRVETERQLSVMGIFYDQLIMGVTGGERVLINDTKPADRSIATASAITVERNKGIESINI